MRFYNFGDSRNTHLLLIPDNAQHYSIFERGIKDLIPDFYITICSFDGFDETIKETFVSHEKEMEQIEAYINEHDEGHLSCAYGLGHGGEVLCSLLERSHITIDKCIIDSAYFEYLSTPYAMMQASAATMFFYPLIKEKTISRGVMHFLTREQKENPEFISRWQQHYLSHNLDFIKKRSLFNQFSSSYQLKHKKNLLIPNTAVHVFFSMKMGARYLRRYQYFFANAIYHYFNMSAQELLITKPDQWALELYSIFKGRI
ncbi:hypothetical protein SAMN04487759_102146 [Kandleria vitulina]|uniref:Alpha/beta hydrolase n=1 Tax=Kandleria vitulina TaxID=1630 RepID=A0A1H2QB83_9FIRM|nr:hypothetical protein [Kandleria vitulina]SDW04382.1 hypothetical protein SAMN04487759_102146 [Kandleria vitulina]